MYKDMFFHCLGVAFPLRYFYCMLKMKYERNPINVSYIINLDHVSSKYIALKGRFSCATEVASAAKCLGDHGLQNAKVNKKKGTCIRHWHLPGRYKHIVVFF